MAKRKSFTPVVGGSLTSRGCRRVDVKSEPRSVTFGNVMTEAPSAMSAPNVRPHHACEEIRVGDSIADCACLKLQQRSFFLRRKDHEAPLSRPKRSKYLLQTLGQCGAALRPVLAKVVLLNRTVPVLDPDMSIHSCSSSRRTYKRHPTTLSSLHGPPNARDNWTPFQSAYKLTSIPLSRSSRSRIASCSSVHVSEGRELKNSRSCSSSNLRTLS
jgi:hypothetical protein